jgi:hypothetical protein
LKNNVKLLFRANEHGFDYTSFHKYCDNNKGIIQLKNNFHEIKTKIMNAQWEFANFLDTLYITYISHTYIYIYLFIYIKNFFDILHMHIL